MSGTIVTDLGLLGIPTTVVGRNNLLTEYLIKRILKRIMKINSVSLVNIIHELQTNDSFNYLINENKIVPELLFENCTIENISVYMKKHIDGYLSLDIENKKKQADCIYMSMFPTSCTSVKSSEIAAKTIIQILSDMKKLK